MAKLRLMWYFMGEIVTVEYHHTVLIQCQQKVLQILWLCTFKKYFVAPLNQKCYHKWVRGEHQ